MSLFTKARREISPEAVQSVLLILLALIEAISVLVVIGLIYQLFPLQKKLEGQVLREWLYLFRPSRDILFYRIFLVVFFASHLLLSFILKKRFGKPDFTARLVRFVSVEFVIVCFALAGLFQYFTYGDSVLAGRILCIWGVLFLLNKVFWKHTKSYLISIQRVFDSEKKINAIMKWWDYGFPFIIIGLIFIPDVSGLVARIFNEDLFYHFDGVIMSASWASLKGGIPDLDMVMPYGIGMPFVIGSLCQWLGGFSYEHALFVLMMMTIVYFVGCFIFIRVWLKNTFLAIAGVLLAIKWQMFHYGADPIIWKYPNGTVVRYFFDIFFFLLLLQHGRSRKGWYLILAALCSGFSAFYVSDCGIYQMVTYFSYLLILLFLPGQRPLIYKSPKDIIKIVFFASLPVITTLICLKMVLRDHLWDPALWQNMGEQISLFVQGFGALPVALNFQDGNAFSFLFGCLILLTYLVVIFIPIGKFYRSQVIEHDEVFAALIGIYGVLIFHYYVCQATAARYFCTSIPFIILMCYGIHLFLKSCDVCRKVKISALLALAALILLVTTRLFIQYPNLITFRFDAYRDERAKMEVHIPDAKDIELIQQMSMPDEKVCLFASNETLILMEADRKPFLYYFPLFQSRNPTIKAFGGMYLFTKQRLHKTLKQLDDEKPAHVFIEKKIFAGELPPVYYRNYESLTIILTYLHSEYILEKVGENIVALRRKNK